MHVEKPIERMEYNTQRKKLKITDYGRNVCKLIEFAKTIENREKRNQVANIIINVMSQVNPNAQDNIDYKHKLWDHLMILSNYELDVDCPYEINKENTVQFTPKPLKYKNHRIKYRHYGKFMEDMINKAIEYPEGEEKEYLTELIAHHLKKSYLTWNRDTVNDELIYEQMDAMSGGKLKVSEDFKLLQTKDYLEQPVKMVVTSPNSQAKPKKKNNAAKNKVKNKNKRSQQKKSSSK